MKTDNELIAEFMQYKMRDVMGTKLWQREGWIGEHETLRFHESWDWLMPVVQRIYKLYDEFDFQTVAQENMFLHVLDNPVKYPLFIVYHDVVEFIKWYKYQIPLKR